MLRSYELLIAFVILFTGVAFGIYGSPVGGSLVAFSSVLLGAALTRRLNDEADKRRSDKISKNIKKVIYIEASEVLCGALEAARDIKSYQNATGGVIFTKLRELRDFSETKSLLLGNLNMEEEYIDLFLTLLNDIKFSKESYERLEVLKSPSTIQTSNALKNLWRVISHSLELIETLGFADKINITMNSENLDGSNEIRSFAKELLDIQEESTTQ